MNNNEHLDKIILYKNLSFDKSADKLNDVKEKLFQELSLIKNPNDLVFSKFLLQKIYMKPFIFQRGI